MMAEKDTILIILAHVHVKLETLYFAEHPHLMTLAC